ncbi:MAG TPA: asparagine synthase-related protein [Polyangiaceae bacterium]
MFVAWSRRATGDDPRSHWGHLPRVVLAPGGGRLGAAAGTSARVSLHAAGDLAAVSVAPPWGPDAATVAEAYGRHRHDLGRHLRGEFAAVVLDFGRDTLFGTSSVTSSRPLAFCPVPGGVLVAARSLDLLAHPEVPGALDETYLAHLITGLMVARPGTTPLRAIRRLRAGEAIVVRGGAATILRVDHLAPRRAYARASLDTCRDAFWETLEDSVRRRAECVAHPCLSFSGGVDSTVVGLAMTRSVQPLAAFSLVGATSGQAPSLAGADSRLLDARNAGVITALDPYPLHDDPVLAALPLLPAQLRQWRAMRDAGFDAVFEGEGGDEIFSLHVSPLQAFRRGQLGVALGFLRRHPLGRALLWRSLVLPHLPAVARTVWYRRWERSGNHLPSYLAREKLDAPEVRSAVRDFSVDAVHRDLPRAIEEWLSTPLRVGARLAYEGLAGACGLDYAAPLVDRDVIELALAIPPRWMLSPEYDKAFLRRALEGRVPDDVRLRPKDVRLDDELAPELLVAPSTRDLLADARVRERLREWVRFQAVERLLDDVRAGYRPPLLLQWHLHCLIAFAYWYRRASREHGVI